ncbi:hypothetical protein BAUCODRAFT_89075 [Baudoinia panamericana UAMH 10762]|uniref:ER membrane protein complex subunit 7 beta-sandwich domain-containing protein n=1 Tax=Baudoinia panamericana (strain UAMH 10762) TaxID=717646 RepID=M2LPE4_BAUPA|nr:uncharacterized protein BAUCODRAFT_89075 [Baudoinia panamericana UAMH 10762]EMC96262.1 hypothetical protein BAUCODRAFT_89075 [Baudoinia panamericana UAMH 10762]
MHSQWRILFLLLASIANAARLTVSIPASPPLLANPATLPSSTHAVLIGPAGVHYDVPIRKDSTFAFGDLAEASYLLTIYSRDYFFPSLRVDVGAAADGSQHQTIQAWQTFRGNEWNNKGPAYGQGRDELKVQVQPTSKKDFYQSRGGFDILGFLKNPMILMGLVSVVFIFGLPKLMDMLDPEMKAEIEEMQRGKRAAPAELQSERDRATSEAVNAVQNFDIASWLAGRSSGGGGSK